MINNGDGTKSFSTDGGAMSDQLHGSSLNYTLTIQALGKHRDDSPKPYKSSEIPGLHKPSISHDLLVFPNWQGFH